MTQNLQKNPKDYTSETECYEAIDDVRAAVSLTLARMQKLQTLFTVLVKNRSRLAPLPEENLIKFLLYTICLEAGQIIRLLTQCKEIT